MNIDDTKHTDFGEIFEAIQMQESIQDVLEEVLYETIHEVLNEFRNDPDGKQSWPVLKLAHVQTVWDSFQQTGEVADRHVKPLRRMMDLVVNNIKRLYANTVITGHTETGPDEEEALTDKEMDKFVEYIDDGHGQMRISDYAMENLLGDAGKMTDESDPKQMIVLMDIAFNRIHRRGDISKYFIDGGNQALTQLSGIDPDEVK